MAPPCSNCGLPGGQGERLAEGPGGRMLVGWNLGRGALVGLYVASSVGDVLGVLCPGLSRGGIRAPW